MRRIAALICILALCFLVYACSASGVDEKFDKAIKKNIEVSLLNEPEFAGGVLTFDSPGRIVILKSEKKAMWTGVRTAYYFTGYLPVKIHVKKDIEIDSFLYKAGTAMGGKIFFQTVLLMNDNNDQLQLSTHFHKTVAITINGPSRDKEKEEKFVKMLEETEVL